MFAKQPTVPTEYHNVIKLSLIAANALGNPEAIFEFPDKKSAEEFFKTRSNGADFFVGGLDYPTQMGGSEQGSFTLIQDKKDLCKISLTIDTSTKEAIDYSTHAHIFSMILACIAEYKRGTIKEFFLKSFNLEKLRMRADDKAEPVETIVKELANIVVLGDIVAKNLKFEISIDVSNLEERTRRYYEGMLELKKCEKIITEAHRNNKEIGLATTTSSAQFSFDQVAVLQQMADERIAENKSRSLLGPSGKK